MANYLAAGVGIGLLYFKLSSGNPIAYAHEDETLRNLKEQGINKQANRYAGKHLQGSGHPGEERYKYNIPGGFAEVMLKAREKLFGAQFLLSAHHFNTQGTTRRMQFKGTDDRSWPTLQMASGWYVKAVEAYGVPYTSRFVQWTAPW